MTNASPSATLIRDLYARMLLTRIVDDDAWELYKQGRVGFLARSRGHEAAQVGSAACIEVGTDFTLPYYRDLGVVLTIGMTPYEVFRTYLQTGQATASDNQQAHYGEMRQQPALHWGYHKHNMVTGPAPVATQILHAAGIAFASKLRKAAIVTVAYCGDGATGEPDFLEGIRFAALHQLPTVLVCEQDCSQCQTASPPSSCIQGLALPEGLAHRRIDGTDVVAVYTAMRDAMEHAREGHGPVLLEMMVTRPPEPDAAHEPAPAHNANHPASQIDPLLRCQQILQEQGAWSDEWAEKLYRRISAEVEQAMQDALRDTL
ncbi:MAG TPA: thiamine pyrophosphate-dependent dehydrogenase E1 component subunit alpha [Ktedonosporobacter sp.]|nr:thiamine pyrophosphate-dependent dehydrogenase E1 component subunit alpha [Ktedonosporobacter sp.]